MLSDLRKPQGSRQGTAVKNVSADDAVLLSGCVGGVVVRGTVDELPLPQLYSYSYGVEHVPWGGSGQRDGEV
jgi:hypothetical protein